MLLLRGGGAAAAMAQYPPAALLAQAVELVAAVQANGFSAADALSAADDAADADELVGECCQVLELPRQPRRGRAAAPCSRNAFYFGRDADGYIIVTPVDSAAWPLCAAGRPLPVRLHRWVAGVEAGALALHRCDNPSCIRRSHLARGTAGGNLFDAHVRQRRAARRAAAPSRGRAVTPAPEPPLRRLEEPAERRESVFCMVGWTSPSKLARARTASGQAADIAAALEF